MYDSVKHSVEACRNAADLKDKIAGPHLPRCHALVSRPSDWLRQALHDLEHAKRSLEAGDYEWACFAAHQAAEKAVKALYQKLGVEVWGHSVSRMLASLPEEHKPPLELLEWAKELDRHYIPTRYPNFYPEGAPMDYYTRGDAERAVRYAEAIIEFCRSKVL
ncbi:MAG: HEPN domain-containing protein [Thermofilaceae archaeon]